MEVGIKMKSNKYNKITINDVKKLLGLKSLVSVKNYLRKLKAGVKKHEKFACPSCVKRIIIMIETALKNEKRRR